MPTYMYLFIGIGLPEAPWAYGGKRPALIHALRAPSLYANAGSITSINSANNPEIFLKFHPYVFVLTALEIRAKKNVIEL